MRTGIIYTAKELLPISLSLLVFIILSLIYIKYLSFKAYVVHLCLIIRFLVIVFVGCALVPVIAFILPFYVIYKLAKARKNLIFFLSFVLGAMVIALTLLSLKYLGEVYQHHVPFDVMYLGPSSYLVLGVEESTEP